MTVSFMDPPDGYDSESRARVVMLPAPYDGTSTWIKGADRGPQAILEASAHMELYDIETGSEPYRMGIFTREPVVSVGVGNADPATVPGPEVVVSAVRQAVSAELSRGRFPVVLGGEHSVSIGAIQAAADHYDDLTVLQLDAHTDLRDCYEGSACNHACVMARAKELAPIVQVGIRSMDTEEAAAISPDRVFFARDIVGREGWQDRVVALCASRVYLTIDLDVFDPAIMPSTGTPEPGGLGWYEVLALLKRLTESCELVGADVVELCPRPENRAPDFLAAKLIYQLLAYRFNADQQ